MNIPKQPSPINMNFEETLSYSDAIEASTPEESGFSSQD